MLKAASTSLNAVFFGIITAISPLNASFTGLNAVFTTIHAVIIILNAAFIRLIAAIIEVYAAFCAFKAAIATDKAILRRIIAGTAPNTHFQASIMHLFNRTQANTFR